MGRAGCFVIRVLVFVMAVIVGVRMGVRQLFVNMPVSMLFLQHQHRAPSHEHKRDRQHGAETITQKGKGKQHACQRRGPEERAGSGCSQSAQRSDEKHYAQPIAQAA